MPCQRSPRDDAVIARIADSEAIPPNEIGRRLRRPNVSAPLQRLPDQQQHSYQCHTTRAQKNIPTPPEIMDWIALAVVLAPKSIGQQTPLHIVLSPGQAYERQFAQHPLDGVGGYDLVQRE